MPRPTILRGVKARSNAHDDYLAQEHASTTVQGDGGFKEEGSGSHSYTSESFLIAKLRLTSLHVSIRNSTSSERVAIMEWPDCSDPSQAGVPAVIAFQDESSPIWGFAALNHPKRIENLRVLLESGEHYKDLRDVAKRQLAAHSQGRTASEVIGEFVQCVFNYAHSKGKIDKKHCRYLFITPGSWGDPEKWSFSNAIKPIVSLDCVSFLDDVEAGALRLGKMLLAQSKRRGILVLNVDGKSLLDIF